MGTWIRFHPDMRRGSSASDALVPVVMGLLLLALLLLLLPRAAGSQEDWLGTLTEAVLQASRRDADLSGDRYGPYLGQLQVVREALIRGNRAAVYRGMNRFMDMLERRQHGISPDMADWLFDLCADVTPPQYHDLSRHLPRT